MFEIVGGIIVLTLMIILSGLKIVKEYDRLVIFRLGKVAGVKGPGLQLIVPLLDKAQVVDTRLTTLPIPLLEDYTHDNMAVKVSALIMFQINDPKKAVIKVDDAVKATGETAQTCLRNTIRQHSLIHLLADKRRLSQSFKSALNKQTRDWGVLVSTVEIKEVKISRESRRLLARQKPALATAEPGEYRYSDLFSDSASAKQALDASPSELMEKLEQLAGY